ncbi:MAG: Xaa-Pro dipeptidyl-peptidase [Tetrasphaera sp.]
MRMRHTRSIGAVLVTGAVVTGTILAGGAASARTTTTREPVIVDGAAQPVFSTDPRDWVTGRGWVTVPVDSDRDGTPDRIHVRWARAKDAPARVPVIFEASPYFAGVNDVPNHDVDHPLYDPRTADQTRPVDIWTAKQWISRGFAWVEADALGTGPSTGCPTTGGTNETLGPKRVIDWLAGRATATGPDSKPVRATWSTGSVGMIGTSYNGTLPNAVASTGVAGLNAIIPISAISDWYGYYRAGGAVVAPEGYQGEDTDVLAKFVLTRANPGICTPVIRDLARRQDRRTGDYSRFWQQRSYLRDVANVRAAVFVAHGLQDWNVKPSQAGRWYRALRAQGTPAKIFWHQGGHGGPPPIAAQSRWFTRYVMGVRNGVENDLRAIIQDDNGSNRRYADWPVPGSRPRSVALADLTLRAGTPAAQLRFTDRPDQSLQSFTERPRRPSGLAFASGRLARETRMSGFASASVRMTLGQGAANLSLGVFDLAPNGSAELVTMGWADPQNRNSLWRTDPITPGQPLTVAVDFEATDHIVPAGHQVAVTLLQTDHDFTIRPPAGNVMTVDSRLSTVTLPLSQPLP